MRILTVFPGLFQIEQAVPPVPRGLRIAARVFLAILIAGMVFYVLVEQIGSRRRP